MLALSAACATKPPTRLGHDPIAGLQRVLAVDFGVHHGERRGDALARWPKRATHELQRLPGAEPFARAAGAEFARPAKLTDDARALVARELRRRPDPTHLVLPTVHRLAEHLADDIDLLSTLFGTWNHPLGEIDDRRHRTRFDDDRPEATLVERILRRLRL